MAGESKKEESYEGCAIGCGALLLFFGFMLSGSSDSKPKAVVVEHKKPAYVHTMPMITEGYNSVWVLYESDIYLKPEEKNPVGFVKSGAAVGVQGIRDKYEWVKIVDAPARPKAGCKLPLDGEYIKKTEGLYMKRFNLITTPPGKVSK